MSDAERPKRKALHRGIADAINPEADATSKLLSRVKPAPLRPPDEPLPTSHHQSPPVVDSGQPVAPERDFNKRANSLERDALPSGLFPGSTKKVYDALYLRTRGAIKPVRKVRASRRDLLDWTGIRNLKTIDNHVRYLMTAGLIIRHWERGSNEGAQYEVKLPEENHYPPLTTSAHQSPPDTMSQKTGSGYTQFLGTGGDSQVIDNTDTSAPPKTFKTKEEKFDDEAFAGFIALMKATVRELTGKEPVKAETDKWRELAELLVTELRIAATRTTVSSVPAFLTEHLRRRLWKIEKPKPDQIETINDKTGMTSEQMKNCPDCAGTGFYYPKGYEAGVAKCSHVPLKNEVENTKT